MCRRSCTRWLPAVNSQCTSLLKFGPLSSPPPFARNRNASGGFPKARRAAISGARPRSGTIRARRPFVCFSGYPSLFERLTKTAGNGSCRRLETRKASSLQTFKRADGTQWGRYRAQYVYRCPHANCAAGVLEPGWLPASSVIDWSLRGQRIGDRTKPLAPKTRERIRLGIARHWGPLVIEAAGNAYDSTSPKHRAHGDPNGYVRAWPTSEPVKTLHTTQSKALVVANTASPAPPLLVPVEGRDRKVVSTASSALRTQSTRNETALLVPMRSHNTTKPLRDPPRHSRRRREPPRAPDAEPVRRRRDDHGDRRAHPHPHDARRPVPAGPHRADLHRRGRLRVPDARPGRDQARHGVRRQLRHRSGNQGATSSSGV